MFGMGWQELALILFIALLLFGAKRVPDIAKSMGKAINSFKKGMKEGADEADNDATTDTDINNKNG
jgi:sec-independent protein translocase protein TatA